MIQMPPARRSDLRAPRFILLAAGLGVAIAMACNWPVVFGRTPLPADLVLNFPPWESIRPSLPPIPPHAEQGDLVTAFYPWHDLASRRLHHGALPAWNSGILLGVPFSSNPLNALFSPTTLLCALLPTPVAWSLGFLVRSALAFIFSALLSRRLGASRSGALAAGVIFSLSASMTTLQGYPESDTALWLPLVFLSIEELSRRPTARGAVAAAVAIALFVLGGQLEVAAFGSAAALAYAAFRFFWPAARPGAGRLRRRFLAAFLAAAVLAAGLCAVQLLPTARWLTGIRRSAMTLHPARPLGELRSLLSRDLSSNPNPWGIAVPSGMLYAGVLTLLLAPAALAGRRRREGIFFLVALAGALDLIYGLPPLNGIFGLAARGIPVIGSLDPGYLVFVVDFALAMLAALGLTAIQERLEVDRAGAAPVLGALAVAGAAAATLIFLPKPAAALGGAQGLYSTGILLAAGAGLLATAGMRRVGPRAFGTATFLLVAVDLLQFAYLYVPFVSRPALYPEAPVYSFLRSQSAASGPFRVAGVDMTSPANVEMMYGLESAGGYDFAPRRTLELLSGLGTVDWHGAWLRAEDIARTHDRRLDLMNVRYLVANTWNSSASTLASLPDRFRPVYRERTVRVFENRDVLPRAFLVDREGVEVIPGDARALARLRDPGFDPEKTVVLPTALAAPEEHEKTAVRAGAPPRVLEVREAANSVSIRYEAPDRRILVVSQSFDPGWKAAIDGSAAPVLRADFGLTAVSVPSGSHGVRLRYRPAGLRAGIFVSVLTIAGCAGVLTATRERCG